MSEQIRNAATILGRTTFKMHTERGLTVESFLTDGEAAAALDMVNGDDREFAQSLLAAFRRYGNWLPNKRAWAHKLAIQTMYAAIGATMPTRSPVATPPAPRPVPRPSAPVRQPAPRPAPRPAPAQTPIVLEMGGIKRLFDSALRAVAGVENAKQPKIVFAMEGGRRIVLSIAGERSRRPGTINVTNGKKYGEADNVWFGRIDPETGVFSPGRDCDSMVVGFLKAFSDDPAGVAARYGRRTGFCCFCNAELTRSRGTGPRCRALYSADVGYGKACARKYGLPYGMAAAVAADGERAVSDDARAEALAEAADEARAEIEANERALEAAHQD